MITPLVSPLSQSEVKQLREWLTAPEAEILRTVLTSNLAVLQCEIGQAVIESVERENRENVLAVNQAHEAVAFLNTLTVLQSFREQDTKLFRVYLAPDAPPKIQPLERT